MSRTFGSMFPNTFSSEYTNKLSMKCSTNCAINNYCTNPAGVYLKITDAAMTYLTINNANAEFLKIVDASNTYLSIVDASNTYLSLVDASNTYLSIMDASNTYLSIVDASNTYLSIVDASNTYLSIVDASNTYLSLVDASNTFLSLVDASNTYLSLMDASNTYLSIMDASNTYLSIVDASNTYLSIVDASNTYLSLMDASNTYLSLMDASNTYLSLMDASNTYLSLMDASNTYLSIMDASNTYLQSIGANPTSVATNTTFTGTINNVIISGSGATALPTGGQNSVSVGTSFLTQIRSVNVGISNTNTLGNDSVSIGYLTICDGAYSTVVGRAATTGSSANYATAIGSFAGATYNYSTALGSGATTNALHQIVIGTSGETIYCPGNGLTNLTGASLIATADIYVNRIIRAGMGNYQDPSSNNTCFGYQVLANATTGLRNTGIGSLALQSLTTGIRNTGIGSQSLMNVSYGNYNTACGDGSGESVTTASYNTFFGYTAGVNILDGTNNTFIGARAGRTGGGMPNNSTGLGYNVVCNYSYSTVIGTGATAGADHQIVIGTSGETIYCPGTSTTNGSIQLAGGLVLQSTYAADPSSNMLGYQIINSSPGITISSIISLSPVSYGSIALTPGVWSINYQVELANYTGIAVTSITHYLTSILGDAYSNRLVNGGATSFNFTYTYLVTDYTPAFSNSCTYYASSTTTFYPTLLINYTGSGLTGTGYYTATRIG
jgi:uncharacterized protein YjbI with pentapeptide repeats